MRWVIPGPGLHAREYCIRRKGVLCMYVMYVLWHAFFMDSTALLVAWFSFLFYLGKMDAGEPAVRE